MSVEQKLTSEIYLGEGKVLLMSHPFVGLDQSETYKIFELMKEMDKLIAENKKVENEKGKLMKELEVEKDQIKGFRIKVLVFVFQFPKFYNYTN